MTENLAFSNPHVNVPLSDPMTPERIALLLRFRGPVQGVGFRYHAWRWAIERGLVGYVRNLPDGAVEACVEGERAPVDDWIHSLQERFHVEHLERQSIPNLPEMAGFEIR